MSNNRSKIWAVCGMIIFMLLLFAFLWLVTISLPDNNDDDLGIELTMMDPEGLEEWENQQPDASLAGDPDVDGGDASSMESPEDVSPEMRDVEAEPEPSVSPMAQATTSPVQITPVVNEDSIRQVELAAAEKARKKAEREKAAAEKKAKQEAALAKAQAATKGVGGSGSGTTTSGSGGKTGNDVKGFPGGPGSGMNKGNSWKLDGRGLVGDIPVPRKENVRQSGVVVVEIQVDSKGNVVNAVVTKGSNVSDATTQQEILKSARNAKFTPSDVPKQVGSITYIITD